MMYNTGDIGRWTTNGSIEILGRQDDQVKLKVR
jgi:non-ribosomal peptide synthetase component F